MICLLNNFQRNSSNFEKDFRFRKQKLQRCHALSRTVTHCHSISPIPLFDLQLISDVPEFLAEFSNEQFWLLSWCSCDGLKAQEFHRCFDGHSNILTLTLTLTVIGIGIVIGILDTKLNIFDCFIWWKSDWSDLSKTDNNLKNLVLTVRNRHNRGDFWQCHRYLRTIYVSFKFFDNATYHWELSLCDSNLITSLSNFAPIRIGFVSCRSESDSV
jgi:hypothetical protein